MIKRLHTFGPRLMAGVGTLALLAAVGLFASRPARSVGGPVPVNVANTVTNQDRDSPARQPVEVNIQTEAPFGNVVYTVPAGKRLVVHSMTLFTDTPGDTGGYTGLVYTTQSSAQGSAAGKPVSYASLTAGPGTGAVSAVTQPMSLHVEPGGQVGINVLTLSGGPIHVTVSLSGYLVDVP